MYVTSAHKSPNDPNRWWAYIHHHPYPQAWSDELTSVGVEVGRFAADDKQAAMKRANDWLAEYMLEGNHP